MVHNNWQVLIIIHINTLFLALVFSSSQTQSTETGHTNHLVVVAAPDVLVSLELGYVQI